MDVAGFKTDMAGPGADGVDVDTGSEQEAGNRVTAIS